MNKDEVVKPDEGLPSLGRIHKWRLLKKSAVKATAFYAALYRYSFAQFFLGFLIAGASALFLSILPTVSTVIFIIGWAVGFTMPVNFIASKVMYKKAAYLSKLIAQVRKNEVMYLHDKIFDGIIFYKRVIMAKKLVKSVNLDNFELIGDTALVKKKLHLSEQSVNDFIKTDSFGLVSRISSEQLLVLESESLIKSRQLEQAIENDMYVFYEDAELANIHKDKCWENPLEKTLKQSVMYKRMRPIAIAVGIAVIAAAFAVGIALEMPDFVGLAFVGFVMVFSYAYFDLKSKETLKNYNYTVQLCSSINNRTTAEIRDGCFNGLSFEQRVIIVRKLINSGNVPKKKLCFDKIIVPELYTDSEAKDQLDVAAKMRIDDFLSANGLKHIRVTASTNCEFCGGILKENNSFCTYCGRKIAGQETPPASPPARKNKSALKIHIELN